MGKRLIITKTSWGGHHLEVQSETGAMIKEYATTKKITNYDDEQLLKVAEIIDVDIELLKKTVEKAKHGGKAETRNGISATHRTDCGQCSCGCGEYLQKQGKKFIEGHYNILVKKLRDSLRKDSPKESREWAKNKMQEIGFTERNLFVGGSLPKGVVL